MPFHLFTMQLVLNLVSLAFSFCHSFFINSSVNYTGTLSIKNIKRKRKTLEKNLFVHCL